MKKFNIYFILSVLIIVSSCKSFIPSDRFEKTSIPSAFITSKDTTNSAQMNWRTFFQDKYLLALIDTALKNNIDLNMALQDIEISRNNIKMRHGALLPNVSAGLSAGGEKVGLYTSQGAGDASAEITPGKTVPEYLGDYMLGVHSNWEIDIWKKLHNLKKAAYLKFLGSIEGKNFVITNLVSEIANSYFELLSLDNQLDIIKQTIILQQRALEIVKVQKQASNVTELAVKKFEAEVLNSQSREFDVQQQIIETENKINFLLARYPQTIIRDKALFTLKNPQQIKEGIPSQLLVNRPDIKQAEYELLATNCDVMAAKAEFYPDFNITGALGFQAFKPTYLLRTPQSLLLSLAGELAAPIINRHAIQAEFNKAKIYQVQAMYEYQKSILEAYIEVSNQLSKLNNLARTFDFKNQEVEALIQSINISNDLFASAKADYFEVLMTQRDALESKLELVEVKKKQYNATIDLYRSLGGGWK